MSNLKGSAELAARLRAVRLMFKPLGRKWADTGVDIGRPMLPVRPATMRAGDGHDPGRLHDSIRRTKATQTKAVIGAHYTAYFIDHGVQPHTIVVSPRAGSTIFAVKHPGYRARPFRAYMAHESLRRHPMAETLIDEWNRAA